MRTDEQWMRQAFQLAKKAEGRTLPNPMVGAVIVKHGKIVATGFHAHAGAPHAECGALTKAGARARGATLYVTLEPCTHFGRTPPCVEKIISSGIARVVCATRDPNPTAEGGLEKLRTAGIKVQEGVREKEARVLNEAFFTFHEQKRPFVSIKFAASLDGKLATRTRDSKWITNDEARAFARYLRGTHQAVIVGIETVLADNPHLGSRTKGLPDPLRIILDSKLRISPNAQVLRDSHVVVMTTKRASAKNKALLQRKGVRVISLGNSIQPARVLSELRKMGVVSVLVEGGGAVIGSFIDARLVDRVHACYAPLLIGGSQSIAIGGRGVAQLSKAMRLHDVSVRLFGDNVLISGSVKN